MKLLRIDNTFSDPRSARYNFSRKFQNVLKTLLVSFNWLHGRNGTRFAIILKSA